MLGGNNEDIVKIWSPMKCASQESMMPEHMNPSAHLRAPLFFGATMQNHDTVTLELSSQVQFEPGSTIKSYLVNKGMPERELYLVGEILTRIKTQVTKDKPFDQRNPSVIICNDELESTFKCAAIDVTQIRSVIFSQSEVVSTPKHLVENPTKHNSRRGKANTNTNQTEYYQLKKDFKRIMESVQLLEKDLYTIEEASLVLFRYILKKRKILLDPRNISIVQLEGDPLGEVIQLKHFHRRQALMILKKQLTEVVIIEAD